MNLKYDKVTIHNKKKFRYRHWDVVLHKYTKTIYGNTLKELKEKFGQWDKLNQAGITDTRQLIADYVKEFLYQNHLVDKKPSTKARYDSTFNCHIKNSYFGKIPMSMVNAAYLQNFYNVKFREKGENVVRNIHKIISPCFRYAKNNGAILHNFAESVKLPKDLSKTTEKIKIKPLTFEEHMMFINIIQVEKFQALFNVALDTGARQGELFALTWGDIDFNQNTITINKNLSYVKNLETGKRERYSTDTKTASSYREIPLPERIKKILLEHKFDQRVVFNPYGLFQDDETLVFCTPIKTPLDSSNVLKSLKKVYGSIGIPESKTFHDLRHTYATRLFELDVPAKTVQVLLGHSDVNVTLNTYTHVLNKQKIKTASLIDAIYSKEISIGYLSVTEDKIKPFPIKETAL
ncbi:MAG: tyrosine-type recombinase/integrase [Eubacteriaceae bacterium]